VHLDEEEAHVREEGPEALVHTLTGICLAQQGHYDEPLGALRHAERLAGSVDAADVLATACGNQANVMMMEHRYVQALARVTP
jgi:hypothetical protein